MNDQRSRKSTRRETFNRNQRKKGFMEKRFTSYMCQIDLGWKVTVGFDS